MLLLIESIIYTPEVVDKIADRILEADAEIKELISNKVNGDYTNIWDYFRAVHTTMYYDPMLDEVLDNGRGYNFSIKDIPSANVTYKGESVNHDTLQRVLHAIQYADLPALRAVVINDRVYTAKYPYAADNVKKYTAKNVLAISKESRLTSAAKLWLRDQYTEKSIVSLISFDEYTEWLKGVTSYLSLDFKSPELKFVLNELWEEYDKRLEVLDFETDESFLEFKQALKDSKEKTPTIKNVILYIYDKPYDTCPYQRKFTHHFDDLTQAITHIKELRKGVVFDNINSAESNNFFAELAVARGYVYITCAKNILTALNEVELTCRVDKSVITKTDKYLRMVATVKKRGIVFSSRVLDTLPLSVRIEYLWLDALVDKHCNWRHYASHAVSATIEEDRWVAQLCDKYNKYSAAWEEAHELVGNSYTDNCKAMIAKILLKRKAYRVSEEYYNIMKNNQLIQELCRK